MYTLRTSMIVDFLTSAEVSNSVWRGKVLEKSVISHMQNLHKCIRKVVHKYVCI